jgi:C1A family cysteine protease
MARIFNLKTDKPDERDFKYSLTHPDEITSKIPNPICLKHKIHYVFDQGQIGSCSANALALAFDFEHGGGPYSRLQIYYNERVMENTVNIDSGAYLRDGIKTLATQGVDVEARWPYNPALFTQEPPVVVVTEALQNTISVYSRLSTRQDFLSCLAAGFPVICGITAFAGLESYEAATTGFVPMPHPGEQPIGGHAVLMIGHNNRVHGQDRYLFQNSWGSGWGDPAYPGCFWLPAAYVENPNLMSDCWSIRR